MVELVQGLDEEQTQAARENLSEEEVSLFDKLKRDDLNKADRERVKQASRDMLKAIKERLAELDRFWKKEQTKGEIEAFILDEIFVKLPSPPFTAEEKKTGRQQRLRPCLASGDERRVREGGVAAPFWEMIRRIQRKYKNAHY